MKRRLLISFTICLFVTGAFTCCKRKSAEASLIPSSSQTLLLA